MDFERDIEKFSEFSEKIFNEQHTFEDELKWIEVQGPYSSSLENFVRENEKEYNCFIFFGYLYWTTFFLLPLVRAKSIMRSPSPSTDPPLYLSVYKRLFSLPRAIIYPSVEVKDFIQRRFGNHHVLNEIIGSGVDLNKKFRNDIFPEKFGVGGRYVITVAREIDRMKGGEETVEFFSRFRAQNKGDINLVLIGRTSGKSYPQGVIATGEVESREMVYSAIYNSKVVIIPSKTESLSLVLLEGMACGRPVLVNGNNPVLKGHVERSGGGLYYRNYEEFEESLEKLLGDRELRREMGEKGRKYVKENYSWEEIERRYLEMIERVSR